MALLVWQVVQNSMCELWRKAQSTFSLRFLAQRLGATSMVLPFRNRKRESTTLVVMRVRRRVAGKSSPSPTSVFETWDVRNPIHE
jgi:hypothetical protein